MPQDYMSGRSPNELSKPVEALLFQQNILSYGGFGFIHAGVT